MTHGDADAALMAAAASAMQHAHAPYSRFAVGAAVRLSTGAIITGANVENASYGLSLCAETVAIATASAQGYIADIVRIAVTGGAIQPDGTVADVGLVTPCGRCRQIINEARDMGGRDDIIIDCASASGAQQRQFRLSALLPDAFGPAMLGITPLTKD